MKKFIAVLAASAMLASSIPAFAAGNFSDDFESYTVDSDLNGLGNWTGTGASVIANPVTGGTGNAIKLNQAQKSATATFDKLDGVVDVSFDYAWASDALGHGIVLKDGDKTIVQLGRINSGTDADGHNSGGSPIIGLRRPDGNGIIQWGNTDTRQFNSISWIGGVDNGLRWYNVRLIIDFDNQTIDAYSSRSKVTDDMIEDAGVDNTGLMGYTLDFPFDNTEATGIDTLRLFTAWGTPAVPYLDNVSVKPYDPTPRIKDYGVSAEYRTTAETATMRFASQVTRKDVDAAGVCVVPVALFNDDFEAANVARVEINDAVTAGETFSADIAGIPASQVNTELIAKSFVVLDGVTQWANFTQQSSVVDANAEIAAYFAAQSEAE